MAAFVGVGGLEEEEGAVMAAPAEFTLTGWLFLLLAATVLLAELVGREDVDCRRRVRSNRSFIAETNISNHNYQ